MVRLAGLAAGHVPTGPGVQQRRRGFFLAPQRPGVDVAISEKNEDGSMLDAAANALMIAGVLVGTYAIYAYWITG